MPLELSFDIANVWYTSQFRAQTDYWKSQGVIIEWSEQMPILQKELGAHLFRPLLPTQQWIGTLRESGSKVGRRKSPQPYPSRTSMTSLRWYLSSKVSMTIVSIKRHCFKDQQLHLLWFMIMRNSMKVSRNCMKKLQSKMSGFFIELKWAWISVSFEQIQRSDDIET